MAHRISNTTNIIGENSVFEGTIKVNGSIRIDGTFLGSELALEHVSVGKTGCIKTAINVNSIVVEGVILGDIHANIRTVLLPTARIAGDIYSPELIIQNGVMWDGKSYISPKQDVDIKKLVKEYFKD
ncbi:MAG: bactofilin family protein [Brevinema sp.]